MFFSYIYRIFMHKSTLYIYPKVYNLFEYKYMY